MFHSPIDVTGDQFDQYVDSIFSYKDFRTLERVGLSVICCTCVYFTAYHAESNNWFFIEISFERCKTKILSLLADACSEYILFISLTEITDWPAERSAVLRSRRKCNFETIYYRQISPKISAGATSPNKIFIID